MKGKMQFSEWFWDKDFDGSSGFEVLLKRLKDGRQMCKDVEDFLRQRAKIEEEYAKQLHKLAKSAGGNTEIGTLGNSWNVVKLQTEAISAEHLEAHSAILEAANRVSDFAERQKYAKKQEEENMKKSIKKKHELLKKVVEAQRSYENRVKDLDNAEQAMHNAKTNPNIRDQDKEKLQKKAYNADQDSKKADMAYKQAVDYLEAHRKTWEKELIKTCDEFEKLEEVRISWLRNELWVHTNIVSQLCVDNDNHCEEMRKVLERCDVDKDLTEFVEKNKTGNDRPGRILYTPITRGTMSRAPAPLPVR